MFQTQGNPGPIKVQRPVNFTMDDNGGAHVEMTLAIENMPPVTTNLTYKPPQDVPAPLAPGRYRCAVVVKVFAYGALNPAYDSTLEVNGQPVATATGSVAANGSDFGYHRFVLEVA